MMFISYSRDAHDHKAYSIDKMGLMPVDSSATGAAMINIDKYKKQFKKILSLDAHPGHISAGFALGVFISFTPFFGLHTGMAIVMAFIFRLNKVACLSGSWVNTPLTVVPVLAASYKLGEIMLGNKPGAFSVTKLEWSALKEYASSIILGSSVIGFFAALAGYALCYWLVVAFRKKDPALEEITREMEEVGEELD
jgi:uncharacterized protein